MKVRFLLAVPALLIFGCRAPDAQEPPTWAARTSPPAAVPKSNESKPAANERRAPQAKDEGEAGAPLLLIDKVKLAAKMVDGEPAQTVEFRVMNAGKGTAKRAFVEVRVEDLRGNSAIISGLNDEVLGGVPLPPGGSVVKTMVVPRVLNGITEAVQAKATLKAVE